MPTTGYKSRCDAAANVPGVIDAEIWVDWHVAHGWVLFDRTRYPTNGSGQLPSVTCYFEVLQTGEIVEVLRSEWKSPAFEWYGDKFESPSWNNQSENWTALDSLIRRWAEREQVRRANDDRNRLLQEKFRKQVLDVFASRRDDLVRRQVPLLGDRDNQLVKTWVEGWEPKSDKERTFYQLAMGSARQAELTAIKIYEDLHSNQNVEDLSIRQLDDSNLDLRWRDADIQIGERRIDVKNARESAASRRIGQLTYVEHRVAKHKLSRSSNPVRVAGFLSDFSKSCLDDQVNSMPATRWLGEVGIDDIKLMGDTFDCPELKLDFTRAGMDSQFFPPWVFDYPSEFYGDRDTLIAELRTLNPEPYAAMVPHAVSILADWPLHTTDEALLSEHTLLRDRVRDLTSLKRPFLFLHILDRFIKSTIARKPFNRDALEGCLFLPPNWPFQSRATPRRLPGVLTSIQDRLDHHALNEQTVDTPLSVGDPLCAVRTLLTTLDNVATTNPKVIREYSSFRLRGLNIFQGLGANKLWETIYAYCGGRDPKYRTACGTNPLWLGRHAQCDKCQRLVCDHCGYCSSRCPSRDDREKLAREKLGAADRRSVE